MWGVPRNGVGNEGWNDSRLKFSDARVSHEFFGELPELGVGLFFARVGGDAVNTS